jgi:hypothetical protein
MRNLRVIVISVVCFGAGLFLGWAIWSNEPSHFYVTSKSIKVEIAGGEVFVLPAKTPLVSNSRLEGTADLGWWGYAPIQFATQDSAMDLGVVPGREIDSILDFTLRAVDE